jgi:hypothetical protein
MCFFWKLKLSFNFQKYFLCDFYDSLFIICEHEDQMIIYWLQTMYLFPTLDTFEEAHWIFVKMNIL